jgi:glycosyltransferase involved in cell wall biosynthesis
MLTFMRRAETIVPALGLAKPDIIVGSSVHLFAVYAAYKLSRLYKVPFVMEVRDLWPQTLIDMGISRWHPFILLLAKLEKFLYKKAKKIITLLPGADTYITGLGIDAGKIVWISNGVDMKPYSGDIRQRDDGLLHVTYAGTIGKANVLDTFFEATRILSPSHPEIYFHVVGSGELTQKFKAFIERHNLKNIDISPAVPKNEIPELLRSSDLLYIGVMDSPLYRYGISMNKIFDYLASSVPVIIASSAFNNPIEEAGAGMTIPPEDTEALVKAILHYNSMDKKERIASVRHVRDYTCKHYSIEALADKFEHTLEGLL